MLTIADFFRKELKSLFKPVVRPVVRPTVKQ